MTKTEIKYTLAMIMAAPLGYWVCLQFVHLSLAFGTWYHA